jgi:hypothetical protein
MSIESGQTDNVVQTVNAPVVELTPAAAAPMPAPAPAARVAPALFTQVNAQTALTRVQGVAAQVVPYAQYQLIRLGVAGQLGLAALVGAIAVAIAALIPTYHALQSLNAELLRAQHPVGANTIEQAVPRLVASLPTRAQIPAVLGQIFAEAQSANVPLTTGRYAYAPAKGGAIAHYEVEFPVRAGYPEIRTFINRTLTVVPAASLEKLHVERKAIGEQVVNADIGFVVYVRSGDGT